VIDRSSLSIRSTEAVTLNSFTAMEEEGHRVMRGSSSKDIAGGTGLPPVMGCASCATLGKFYHRMPNSQVVNCECWWRRKTGAPTRRSAVGGWTSEEVISGTIELFASEGDRCNSERAPTAICRSHC